MSFYLYLDKLGAQFPSARLDEALFKTVMEHAYHHGFRGEKLLAGDVAPGAPTIL